MPRDTFRLFRKSVEDVSVKKTERGTFDGAVVYQHSVKAIVKRRNGMSEAASESEDRNTLTTIHFMPQDAQYVEEGNFVLVDGRWRAIERWVDGKDFAHGRTEFIKAWLGDQIEDAGGGPVWQ